MAALLSAPKTMHSDLQLRVTWLLVVGLFLLRIPFFTGLLIFAPDTEAWVDPVYMIGTYLLTSSLIWWEREHLAEFHIDAWVLLLFLVAKPLESLYFGLQDGSVAYVLIALALGIALLLARPHLPGLTLRSGGWLGIGLLAGLALAAYHAKILGALLPGWTQSFSWSAAQYASTQQLLSSGLAEEPFFRGFLWGCLRKAGVKDVWIWLLQAGLFWLGHLFSAFNSPPSFWLIVPFTSLVLGLLAWRSRSVAPGMIAHGLANGLSQYIAW